MLLELGISIVKDLPSSFKSLIEKGIDLGYN